MESAKGYNREVAKRMVTKVFFTVLVGAVAISMITPFLWILSASVKLPLDVMKLPIEWMPKYFYLDNYKKVWNVGGLAPRDYHFALAYWNPIKIAMINLIGSVLASTLAGYAPAKIKFRENQALFLLYLATMMIPSQVTLTPKFVMFSRMGLTGTHLTLILPGLVTITGTFLMRQYFMQIPDELRELARADGANEHVIWARIMVPIVRPSMASLAIVAFLWNWNSYLEPLIFLSDWRLHTIPITLTNSIEESVTEYSLAMAAAASALVPAFLVFIFGQKFLVKGLVSGAVKG